MLKELAKLFKGEVSEVPTPVRSSYKHRGFLLSSQEPGKVNDAIQDFCEIWRQYATKSNLTPPHSNICTSYNEHESAAIFPAGGREMGMLYLEEQLVHETFEQRLAESYPEIQWVHVYYDAEGASVLGHTGL
jgi:hypothetical protein